MKLLESSLKRYGVSSHLAYGLHPLIGALREREIGHLPLLEKAGIAVEALDNPERRLSPHQELSFTELAIDAIGDPELGLVMGSRYHLSNYGILGLAAMTSANLLEALGQFTKYYLMTWTYFSFSVEEVGEQVIVEATGERDLGNCYRYMVDRDLCATYTIAKEALGEDFSLHSLSITHEKPYSTHRYDEIFQCPISFGAKRNAVHFARPYLSRSLAQSEAESCRVFEKQCARICENLRKSTSFSELIRQHLLQEPNRVSSLETLAERFHTSPRSIQRKLAVEGTSYKDLLDDIRKNLAIEYLNSTSLPLTEIAVRLGYSEAPNFSNAFKRWTGTTPGEFRLSEQRSSPKYDN